LKLNNLIKFQYFWKYSFKRPAFVRFRNIKPSFPAGRKRLRCLAFLSPSYAAVKDVYTTHSNAAECLTSFEHPLSKYFTCRDKTSFDCGKDYMN